MNPVFVLSNASTYGGGERSLEAILPHLASRMPVQVFVENARHFEHVTRLAGPTLGVTQLAGGRGIRGLAGDLSVVYRQALASRPRAIVANANKAALVASLLRATTLWRVPVLFFVRDFQWRNRRAIFRLARAPRIVVPSPAVAEHAYWSDLLAGYPVDVIPNAVPSAGVPVPCGDGRTILCLANFGRWKGIHLLIQAFARCAPHTHGMRLVVAGSPHDKAYFEECRELARENGVAELVTFAPFTDDPARLYQQCAMVVVASISKFGGPETFSRTVIEAWAHGRPVIAFNVGGPRYLIRDGVDGFLAEEGDLDGLAAKMTSIWSDPALGERLGAAGYSRAASEFSADAIADRVAAKIESMIGGTE
jgi:glycosyltransferase involved in cell wall biosynthesis